MLLYNPPEQTSLPTSWQTLLINLFILSLSANMLLWNPSLDKTLGSMENELLFTQGTGPSLALCKMGMQGLG